MKDYITKNTEEIKRYLEGTRKSNRICTTVKVAHILEKKLHIELIPNESVNQKLGLYMFLINKKE